MKKTKIQTTILLLTTNVFFALLALFFIKLFRNNYSIENFILWAHDDTKKMAFYFIVLLLFFLATAKLQFKTVQYAKGRFPWFLTISKYIGVFFLTLFTAIIVNYFFQYFQWLQDPVNTTKWITDNSNIFIAGVLYLQMLFLLVFAIIGNVFISSFLTSVLLLLLGFVHYNKLNLRAEPLYPMDFLQISQVKDVIPMVREYLSVSFAIGVLLGILFLVLWIIALPKMKLNVWVRVSLLCVSFFLVYSYTNFPKTFMNKVTDYFDVAIVQWNQPSNYETNGFLFGFIYNLYNDSFVEPDNYSKAHVLEVANKYKNSSDQEEKETSNTPNIVYLMSEAFWDPTKLPNVNYSGDPMGNLRRLMTEYTSGQLVSPVYGGATANVEFEALAGVTTSFLKNGSIPYQELVDRKNFIPTIVSDLEKKGYSSLAIHPYKRIFYKRNAVYNTFGIDEFLDEETMANTERTQGGVISDKSLTNEIMDSLKKEDKPLFIHAVSMQNHMPYNPGAYENTAIQVSGLTPESIAQLEVYTEGIRRSDEALQQLVNELEMLDEPTMVVFWGDHLPVLGANRAIFKEAGFEENLGKVDEELLYHETPLLIYSNFDVPKQDLNSVSSFYLASIVYELSGMEKPVYFHLLSLLQEQISAIKEATKINSDREIMEELTKKQKELLEDYRLLSYDLLVGKQYSLSVLYGD